jgi:hypothetical protein
VTNPAAWHPDPTGAHEYRWWDGTRWTEHVADGGEASVDPLAGGPGSAAAGSEATETVTASDTGRLGGSGEGHPAEDASSGEGGSRAAWQQPEADATAEQQPSTSAQGWQQPEQTWQQPADQGAGGGQPPTWQQTPAWSQPGAQQPAASGNNGIAIAALIIGIISLLIAWIPFLGLLGGIGGVVALILGFMGRKRANDPGTGGSGAAITGIVTGILALILTIVVHIAVFTFGSTFVGSFETYEECIEAGGTDEECQRELERDIMRRFGQ